jgi:hypothetical protein
MRLSCKIVTFLVVSLLVVNCATTQRNISGGRYESPLQNFSISLPNWPGLKVEDKSDSMTGWRVSFTSDFGDLWAITYLKVPADLKPRLHDPAQRDIAYSGFLKNYVMPDIILPASPRATIVHEEFLNEDNNRTYFAVINIPEASAMMRGNKRLDSVRGLIVFSKNDFMYMLEDEMNTMAEEIKFGQINSSSLNRARLESSQQTLKHIKDSIIFK